MFCKKNSGTGGGAKDSKEVPRSGGIAVGPYCQSRELPHVGDGGFLDGYGVAWGAVGARMS